MRKTRANTHTGARLLLVDLCATSTICCAAYVCLWHSATTADQALRLLLVKADAESPTHL